MATREVVPSTTIRQLLLRNADYPIETGSISITASLEYPLSSWKVSLLNKLRHLSKECTLEDRSFEASTVEFILKSIFSLACADNMIESCTYMIRVLSSCTYIIRENCKDYESIPVVSIASYDGDNRISRYRKKKTKRNEPNVRVTEE